MVGSFFFPTGSARKLPTTGAGSPSFFLGTTLNYLATWWAIWIQAGAFLSTSHHGIKNGNNFLYQTGIERCLYAKNGWILAFLLEGFGIFQQKDKICGIIDKNSGGNTFWIGPSFWASSQTWIFQAGIAIPAVQKLNGCQRKYSSYLNVNIGYKF